MAKIIVCDSVRKSENVETYGHLHNVKGQRVNEVKRKRNVRD
jgi:hypothetical protein